MIELKRILLPTDFSESNLPATNFACAFAEKFGAELHLLHVTQDIVALVPEPGLAFPAPGDYLGEMQASAEAALGRMLDPAWVAGQTVVRATRQGPPFLEIVRYAREQSIDMIVMGTHGRSGLSHVLMGSVAERVVRKAPCPVLTVRPTGHVFEMP